MTDPTRRTSAADLLAPGVAAAAATFVLARLFYDSFPALHLATALPIVVLAAAESVVAARVRAAVSHRPAARLMSALAVARCMALAKASALVAALVVGFTVGLLLRVVPDAGRVSAARNDAIAAAVLLAAAAALLVAALILEGAAVDPSQRDGRP